MNYKNANLDAANISIALTERAEELLEALGIDFRPIGNGFQMACPIHLGDAESGFTLYTDDGSQGVFKCWTRGCEREGHVNTTLGFLRAVLSTKADRPFGFGETIKWARNFLGNDIPNYLGGVDLKQKKIDNNLNRVCVQERTQTLPKIDSVMDRLLIPSPYFLSRGFSGEILEKFYVGEPKKALSQLSPLFDRAVVPILDRDGVSVMGYTARARNDEIKPKWYHQDINTGQVLYGFYSAQKSILERQAVILVEGPGDLWRLREAGIENSVCMFGTSLKEQQQIILECSGCFDILVATDADEAGEIGYNSVLTSMGQLCNIKRKRPPNFKDWGEESLGTIKGAFL